MRIVKAILIHMLGALVLWGLWQPLGPVPAPATLLDPVHGILGSARTPDPEEALFGISTEAIVQIDSFGVPFIIAASQADAYFLQGYLTARDRLWQMDFMTRIAAGRLSEILGADQLETDRYLRRIGMVTAARTAATSMMQNDTTRMMITSYCNGVNAWIDQLPSGRLPIEYKLLGYRPEHWSPLKVALILKLMCLDLTGYNEDIERTSILRILGPERYVEIFPMYPAPQAPIIPSGSQHIPHPLPIPADTSFLSDARFHPFDLPGTDPMNGSNNWALDGSRTTTGYPVLCNDPHLRLSLPPIWYEIGINDGQMSVHGVSIPGTPGVIIGFNKNVAWGVTNASRDVWDWYSVRLSQDNATILLDGKEVPVSYRIDTILVKGQGVFMDTTWITPFGPVVYDASFRKPDKPAWLALHWQAHQPSNEPLFFYRVNHATNRSAIISALPLFETPAQNVVFADTAGIGICQAGTHLLRPPWHGVFILDGTRSSTLQTTRIPAYQNPFTTSPPQGFLFSANQHPTGPEYPYPVYGVFDHTRGRRLQQLLSGNDQMNPSDIRNIQADNVSLKALDAARLLFRFLGPEAHFTPSFQLWKEWFSDSCTYLPESEMPVYCEMFCDSLMQRVWDDWKVPGKTIRPDECVTFRMLMEHPDAWYVDRSGTTQVEHAADLVNDAFTAATAAWEKLDPEERKWGNYQPVTLQHYTRLPVWGFRWNGKSGSPDCINALGASHGPSVRFSVSLGPEPLAWIHLPGGQSGYPSDPLYQNQFPLWKDFRYREVRLTAPMNARTFTFLPR